MALARMGCGIVAEGRCRQKDSKSQGKKRVSLELKDSKSQGKKTVSLDLKDSKSQGKKVSLELKRQ